MSKFFFLKSFLLVEKPRELCSITQEWPHVLKWIELYVVAVYDNLCFLHFLWLSEEVLSSCDNINGSKLLRS